MRNKILFLGIAACAVLVGNAYADSDLTQLNANVAATKKAAAQEGWQGSVSLGYLHTTGNSNTVSLNGQALAGYKHGPWQDVLSFQALNASQNGQRTAESYEGTGQSNYSFTPSDYVFGLADYLADRFSGFRHRTTEVLGYGRRLLQTDTQQLDAEFGVGGRQTHYITGVNTSEFIERAAVNYLWKFTDKSNFSENLSVEHGPDNTFTQSITALTTNLAGNFALSVSYTVKHNSTVLPTFKNTDTITAVSLVYSY